MNDPLWAVCLALLSWWLSTGIILYLNHRPGSSHRWSLLAASALMLACLFHLPEISLNHSRPGVVLGFCAALAIWAWLEMSYLMGFVTGPRKAPCPDGTEGWQRFRLALQTSLYHELAVMLAGVLILALTWGGPNQVAAWSFLVLWLMRWSAKLNLFLGVLNYNQDWLPEHLQYLGSYIRRRSMNPLFPLSVGLGTIVATALISAGLHSDQSVVRSGHVLVGTLLALAVLEHWFLMLPLRDSALWQWALQKTRNPGAPAANAACAETAATGDSCTSRSGGSAAEINFSAKVDEKMSTV